MQLSSLPSLGDQYRTILGTGCPRRARLLPPASGEKAASLVVSNRAGSCDMPLAGLRASRVSRPHCHVHVSPAVLASVHRLRGRRHPGAACALSGERLVGEWDWPSRPCQLLTSTA
eukprot:scaffold2675_cov398-Prasinococcus_capsulatus_cf.AAC.2